MSQTSAVHCLHLQPLAQKPTSNLGQVFICSHCSCSFFRLLSRVSLLLLVLCFLNEVAVILLFHLWSTDGSSKRSTKWRSIGAGYEIILIWFYKDQEAEDANRICLQPSSRCGFQRNVCLFQQKSNFIWVKMAWISDIKVLFHTWLLFKLSWYNTSSSK